MNQKSDLKKRSILLGLAIGDGHISHNKNGACLVIRHGLMQEDYVNHKISLLQQIYPNRTFNKYYVQNGVQIAVSDTETLRVFRKWLYPYGKKQISNILHFLDLQAIALWYMDDGSLTAKKHKGKVHSYELTLNTYVCKAENQKFIDFFKSKYDINFTQTKARDFYRLRMGKLEAKRFFSLIEPYIIDSMQYKITMN